ncbi:MAG: hypothetical protein GX299_04355 [Epulopiscium sp.]|jgi:penicillin-binding protein 2|nr:hypothetical protein [Candidatus Epulonipiscium sp.]
MKRLIDKIRDLSKSRVFVMLSGICLLFFILAVRLFILQIILGETYQKKLTTSVLKTVEQPASRGCIYDRYGRPLATNRAAYSVKIDDSITLNLKEYKNSLVLKLYDSMVKNGYLPQDNLPISATKPYTFTFEGTEKEQKKNEEAWKLKSGLPKAHLDLTAEETLTYLMQTSAIPEHYSLKEKRCILSLMLGLSDKNLMVLSLIQTLEENKETLVDDLPITQTTPYTFLFDGNKGKERSWKESVGMSKEELNYNAEETVEYLRDFFDLPEILPQNLVRSAISLRYSMYQQRYRKYQPVTVALDISDKTLATVEESQDTFPGILIDTDSLREYPMGESFSHIIGYIRKMSEEDYAEYKDDTYPDGDPVYHITDIVGKTGIEKVEERNLNGKDGEMIVEVDSLGRRMNTLESKEPISGKNVYLTLDSRLQQAAYNILEDTLTGVVKTKINYASKNSVSTKQLFISMVNGNTISVSQICNAQSGESYNIYQKILQKRPDFSLTTEDDTAFAKQVITDGIEDGSISPRQLILVMIEQGKISADEEYLGKIKNGTISPLSVINQKLDSKELHPSDTHVDPCTGSIVVSRVDSGEVLALVTYPSYDNNELVNNFNNSYYNQLLNDPNTPLVNRPLKEKKAPGSTLKMITALAGLESGVITPYTTIRDLGYYKKAGTPYPKCWIYGSYGGTHGNVNVSSALEVSCNYFFYETAFRLGNAAQGTTENSITTLNEYMAAFGLNDYTGIEIGETQPNIASPNYKERTFKSVNPDATTSQTRWTDGDTIRAAIGQSVNNFAPAHMNKYIATLANGGTRYKMHLLSKIENPDGTIDTKIDEQVENILELQEANLKAVYKGMLMVTRGNKGTLRGVFKDFPVDVAAKSGTAEEKKNKSSHTWFVAFAPADDPQIAITVMIPFGEESGSPAAVVAREVIREYMGLNYQPSNTYMETILAK